MAFMTNKEQIESHILFLRNMGLDVEELQIDVGFVRCHAIGETKGRGELSYATTSSRLEKGFLGFSTTCLCKKGKYKNHKTYGEGNFFSGNSYSRSKYSLKPLEGGENYLTNKKANDPDSDQTKVAVFWKHSSLSGHSDYLRYKNVGSYGIRFRNNKYGKVAVIPMWNIMGKLCSYQLLNPNGTKVFAKNIKIKGLSHALQELKNGKSIGIAESYVTAATCFELSGISTVNAFSSNNLLPIAEIIRKKYPDSKIIMFADNDAHLAINCGVKSAMKVVEKLKANGLVAIPQFEGCPVDKDHTDWNDLVREKGRDFVKEMLTLEIK